MKFVKKLIFSISFVLILIVIISRYFIMQTQANFIVEIDNTKNYSHDIVVNYNSVNITNGYHRLNRTQTLLSKGNIYKMEPQDSQIIEYYIKNKSGYLYKGQWNLEYHSNDESLHPSKKKDNNKYKLIITPTEESVIFSNYRNDVKINVEEVKFSPKIGRNYFDEPVDLNFFTKFSLPKTSKFEPYLSGAVLEKLKNMQIEELKRNNSYLIEKYVKKLNLNDQEIQELKDLELIRAE